METVFPLWNPVTLPVSGSDKRFPVRRVFCVGRNYAEHAREMGHDPDRDPPFFFIKPADSIAQNGAAIAYPPLTQSLHHEVELAAAIGSDARDLTPDAAEAAVFGYAVAIDLTRRDLQAEAKSLARPWEVGKTFDGSAPCGSIHPVGRAGHPRAGAISLQVNQETRQQGDLAQMIWSVPEVVSRLSQLFGLKAGDLIFTGTPSGVGAVEPGDRLHASIEGLSHLAVSIAAPAQGQGSGP